MNHFTVKFPEFGEHLSLFVHTEVFLAGIKEMLVFLFYVFWIEVAQFPSNRNYLGNLFFIAL